MRHMKVLALILTTILVSTFPAHADGARQDANVIIPEGWQSTYEQWGFAPAVEVDGVIYASGVISMLEGEGSYEERYGRGFETALRTIEATLKHAGASLDDVVEITTFHTDIARQIETAAAVRRRVMTEPHPAWTAVGTTGLAVANGQTEIKVIAHRTKGD